MNSCGSRLSSPDERDTGRAMPQEKGEVMRKPLRVRQHSSRTFDQRLAVRFPRLAAAYIRLIFRMPPTSASGKPSYGEAPGSGWRHSTAATSTRL